ncbi:oligosaccharide biosynthesis protein Alg14 [Algoriphagus winogradskyi]|uniref:Oligosaccharide biosynthesis protein Alg14 like n=1 Tax=Algoriphagus winogradskyi TaxID=237017 RepID=A0ABY1PFQ7_9BACT|nr:oligosaccharide biosynthesis protein Alg14 [Algoriphagus winogradskyi]SMP33415.1 Oligosaccharide biosynthesis protein Alg14 like [Algoriphagus winogradskyi]
MKVIAISSIGGHWIQLLRLRPAFAGHELVFVSTNESFRSMVPNSKFYAISDGNRSDIKGLLSCVTQIFTIIRIESPDVIVTTGAAPGLIALIIGMLFGCKTIWIDSIANCEKLSLSGKIASKFANRVFTQWEHLKTDNVSFKGNVLK